MRNGLISIGVVVLLFLFGAGCSSVAETGEQTAPSPDDRIQQTLERELHAAVLDRLHLLDQTVLSAAAHAAAVGLDDPSTHEVLANVTDTFSDCVIDVITIDADGRITGVYPPEFASAIGSDISAQPHIRVLLDQKKPVLSGMIRTVEGVDAAVLAYPVLHPDGTIAGGISALFSPAGLIDGAVNSFEMTAPFRALVITVDGLILYSPDEEEIGEVLFSDPGYALFVDVERFMTRIGVEERGSATVGLSGVQKQIIWDTVLLHGTDWRLLVIKEC
ncbi:hypothetical protein [Methanocalculus sp.]|uniref:hypothetical protein n=1 Tax=Methanocalculus sp. TaxID=2004547 RepID=UPI00271A9CAE|nr:hypothetical protein [Methanocalculus sp.]MDO8841719.1 hypothetical protein [Methanocalculus sp.]